MVRQVLVRDEKRIDTEQVESLARHRGVAGIDAVGHFEPLKRRIKQSHRPRAVPSQ